MLEFVNRYASNTYSQNGEDGIVAECLRRMQIGKGSCVEIGANDGQWCSNTARLIELGFSGLMIEADAILAQRCEDRWRHNPDVITVCCEASGRNVNAFVTRDVELFSADTDGCDYDIFAGLKAKPKICIVEIDSSLPPLDHVFNKDGGAGYLPMVELGLEKGYFVLSHTGNLIFVDTYFQKLFPEVKGDPIKNCQQYFNCAWQT